MGEAFCHFALQTLFYVRDQNWARGKRRGFSPGAAARHSQSALDSKNDHFYQITRAQRAQPENLVENGLPARPYESCKILKGRPRRNAFSKLVHHQYKSFPTDMSGRNEKPNQIE